MPSFKTQNALLLHVRALGEKSFLLSLFTPEKGRYIGVVKTKNRPDIASFVDARWQARLEEQIGSYYLDNISSFAANFLDDKKRLSVISSVCELLHQLLPERQTAENLYTSTIDLLKHLSTDMFLGNYLRWEVLLLSEIGFGLDFSKCAGGGNSNDLAYVSPKTGRAVSWEKGKPYHDKLLVLPRFLWCSNTSDISQEDLLKGFVLTSYFLTEHAGLHHLPVAREQLVRYILTEKTH